MATVEDRSAGATHEVLNQASPLENDNVFDADRVLVEALGREGADWAEQTTHEVGALRRQCRLPSAGAARRTRTRRGCARTTGSATGSTRSSSTPPGTS